MAQDVFTLQRLSNFLELAPLATQRDPSLATIPGQLKALDARTVSSILQLGVRLPQSVADLHAVVLESAQYYLRLYASLGHLTAGTIPAAFITYEGQENGGLVITSHSVRRDQPYPSQEIAAAIVGRPIKALVYMTRVQDAQVGVPRLTLVVTTPVANIRADMFIAPTATGMSIATQSSASLRGEDDDPFLGMLPPDPNLPSYLFPTIPPPAVAPANGNGNGNGHSAAPTAAPTEASAASNSGAVVSEPTTWPVTPAEPIPDEPEMEDDGENPMDSMLDDEADDSEGGGEPDDPDDDGF